MIGLKKNSSFLTRLEDVIATYALNMTDAQKECLLEYLEQLHKWNKTYNLTAIRDQEQALVQHLFDSLSIVRPLQRHMQHLAIKQPKIMDVGSGGGLPGVILAITFPEASVNCVDAVEKKVAFIRHVAGVLQLNNLKALHTRIEELPDATMDIVTSRAFASLIDFATLAGKHVSINGALVAMKGKHPENEIVELNSTDWVVKEIETLTVPELDAERCLVWMRRKGKK
jgi:16S rRNA (guanine527-N7)-methyltransferase